MLAISITLFVLAAAFAVVGYMKLTEAKQYGNRLDERSASLCKREEACREAMRRNGIVSLELDNQEQAFAAEHKSVSVSYAETEEDRARYPSEAKRLAVVKSRLAHNIGYMILSIFPDPDIIVPEEEEGGLRIYSYGLQVRRTK